MEKMKRNVLLLCAMIVMVSLISQDSATKFTVGGCEGWSTTANMTLWTQDKHFYNGNWIFFVYDNAQMNVLEVNKIDCELCNADHPLQNWTTGSGRDVVPLNVIRHYYMISGKGFCYSGMKIAINVENPPPPPTSAASNKECIYKIQILYKSFDSSTSCACNWSTVGCVYPFLVGN